MTFRSKGLRGSTQLPFVVFAVDMIVFTVVVVVVVVVVVAIKFFLDGEKRSVLTFNFLMKFKNGRDEKV